MKKVFFLLLIAGIAQSVAAQNAERTFKPFKVDVSLGYAMPRGSGTKAGALFVVEPKYAVVDNISVGLRMEAAVTARALITSNGEEVSGNVSASGSYLATGDYYFTDNKFRPFAGAGAGIYTLASVDLDSEVSGVSEIPSDSKFGFMLRGGFEAGHFRMGAEYNFIGKSGNIKNGYLGVKLGVVIGGGRY